MAPNLLFGIPLLFAWLITAVVVRGRGRLSRGHPRTLLGEVPGFFPDPYDEAGKKPEEPSGEKAARIALSAALAD